MKKLSININSELKDVEITVKNGAKFQRSIVKGEYDFFDIVISPADVKRVKQYVVRNGNDNSSNNGRWYAHCNGFSMDLFINYKSKARINTFMK